MSKELLQTVINDANSHPVREDEDWVWGNLSERYASLVVQYLPFGPSVKVYRSFRPTRDSWEFTVYVKHNKFGNMRLDFEVNSDELEAWGDNTNDILVNITRFYIKDYLPEFEKSRNVFSEQ